MCGRKYERVIGSPALKVAGTAEIPPSCGAPSPASALGAAAAASARMMPHRLARARPRASGRAGAEPIMPAGGRRPLIAPLWAAHKREFPGSGVGALVCVPGHRQRPGWCDRLIAYAAVFGGVLRILCVGHLFPGRQGVGVADLV